MVYGCVFFHLYKCLGGSIIHSIALVVCFSQHVIIISVIYYNFVLWVGDIGTCGLHLFLPQFQPWENKKSALWLQFKKLSEG